MKKTFALLVASTALGGALGLPAFSAFLDPAGDGTTIARPDDQGPAPQLLLASNDDDDDDGEGRWGDGSRRGHDDDDDDDDDDDCDDDDDDDDGCRNGARNPAPAGTVAPPQNGLFGNGAPPRVQMN